MAEPYSDPPVQPLFEKRKFTAIDPSQATTHPLLVLIQKIVRLVREWFYPCSQTPYIGLVAALDRRESEGTCLSKEEMLSYLTRFCQFENEVAATACLQQLREQYGWIESKNNPLQVFFGSEDLEKIEVERAQIQAHWKAKLQSLQEGEQAVLIARAEPGDEMFYLFLKSSEGLSVKVVGRGKAMGALSQKLQLPGCIERAGRVQLTSALKLGLVEDAFLQELLDHSVFGNKCPLEPWDKLVCTARDPPNSPLLETKTGNVFHLFQTLMREVGRNEKRSDRELEREVLRLELFTLFSFIKDFGTRWQVRPIEKRAVDQLLHLCAQRIAEARHMKQLSEDEVVSLTKSLSLIEEQLDRGGVASLASIRLPSMASLYPSKSLSVLKPVEKVFAGVASRVRPERDSIDRLPAVFPEGEGSALRIPKDNVSLTQGARSLEETLHLLVTDASIQEIIQGIYDVDFSPFKPDSEWQTCSQEEGKRMMAHLNMLSKRLVDTYLLEPELPLTVYEVLVKMTYMVFCLNYRSIPNHTIFIRNRHYIESLNNMGQQMVNTPSDEDAKLNQRCGLTLTPHNLKIRREIAEVFHYLSLSQYAYGGTVYRSDALLIHSEWFDLMIGNNFIDPNFIAFAKGEPELNQLLDEMTDPVTFKGPSFRRLSNRAHCIRFEDACEQFFARREAPMIQQMDLILSLHPLLVHEAWHHHPKRINLLSSCYHWVPSSLPAPLLAAYHDFVIQQGFWDRYGGSSVFYYYENSPISVPNPPHQYSNTPEGLHHDPQRALKEITESFDCHTLHVNRENGKKVYYGWNDSVNADYVYFRNAERCISCSTRHFSALEKNHLRRNWELRRRRLHQLEKMQKACVDSFPKDPLPFTKEELSALLAILRKEAPQKEVMAFMGSRPALLAHASVRSFLHLIFFHPSLLDTLKNDEGAAEQFPRLLAETIERYRASSENHPEEQEILLFLVQMSEQLKGIYQALQKEPAQAVAAAARVTPEVAFDNALACFVKKVEGYNRYRNSQDYVPDSLWNGVQQAVAEFKAQQDPMLSAKAILYQALGTVLCQYQGGVDYSVRDELFHDLERIRLSWEPTPPVFAISEQALCLFYDTSQLSLVGGDKEKPNSGRIVCQVQSLLAKEEVTAQEIGQILVARAQLSREQACDADTWFALDTNYRRFLRAQPHRALSANQMHWVCDTICHQQGLATEEAPWRQEGDEVVFTNGRYRVDLKEGRVSLCEANATTTLLPARIVNSSPFREAFPHLEGREIRAFKQSIGSGATQTTLYSFQDEKQNQYRVEEREGTLYYYRSFPELGPDKLLQFVTLETQPPEDNWQRLWSSTHKPLPCLLQKRLFVEAKRADASTVKGYTLSDEETLELEVTLSRSAKGAAHVTSVVDLRGKKSSKPLQLMTVDALPSEVQALEQIEDPHYILVWGQKGGAIEKIELPRYGLTFVVSAGHLVCADPRLSGYRVNLSASIKERGGFLFSLLLEPVDPKRPKKLLLPPASMITKGEGREDLPSGLAFLVWLFRSLYQLLKHHTLPHVSCFPKWTLAGGEGESFEVTLVTLRHHTREVAYDPDYEVAQRRELLLHAARTGEEGVALDLLRTLTLSEDRASIQTWLSVAEACGPVVGLPLCESLFLMVHGKERFRLLESRLHDLEARLLKSYVPQIYHLPPVLQVAPATFCRIAAAIQQSDPCYYACHLAPFLREARPTPEASEPAGDPHNDAPNKPLSDAARWLEAHQVIVCAEEQLATRNAPERRVLELTRSDQSLLKIATEHHFKGSGLTNGKTLLQHGVTPKVKALQRAKKDAEATLHTLLYAPATSAERLAFYAQEKHPITPAELLLALLQDDFALVYSNNLKNGLLTRRRPEFEPNEVGAEAAKLKKFSDAGGLKISGCPTPSKTHSSGCLSIQARLPTTTDPAALKKAVQAYYDLEIQYQLAKRAHEELISLVSARRTCDPATWKERSAALQETLQYTRAYDPDRFPELLAFEAFHFLTFRNGVTPQLDLLKTLLEDPQGILQAGTGTGKSSVLIVLRGLLRADGTNLVTQKVLPHLYSETLELLQTCLGNLQRKVYPLRFNLAMPLCDQDHNSLFQDMYRALLETMQHKGCVLTDYKSFPLLEQKFISLSQQLAHNPYGEPMLRVHWFYLGKILLLFKEREEQLMDEFDQPLSATQRIQTQLRPGPRFESWMIEASLGLYKILAEDKALLLTQNLQGDLTPETRQAAIARAAIQLAQQYARGSVTSEILASYFMGTPSGIEFSEFSPEERDTLAFLKDQCTLYAPLTLDRSSGSHYGRDRSEESISTRSKGERREAKFGNPPEEINFTIQDYLQKGVALAPFKRWVEASVRDWKQTPDAAEQRFAKVLPGVALKAVALLSSMECEANLPQWLQQVNANPNAVWFFLKRHLEELTSSGMVVSMNPQDSVEMSHAVSGISATTGAFKSLHPQFHISEEETVRQLDQAKKRLQRRTQRIGVAYDPRAPLAVLHTVKDPKLCAIIDGCGAFRDVPSRQVAEALLRANCSLCWVGYYDETGKEQGVGDPEAPLQARGFYFPQAHTRGSDQKLRPDGSFLHMTTRKGHLEDFIQEAGRARGEEQRLIVATSSFAFSQPPTLSALIAIKQENQEAERKEDFYRAQPQHLHGLVRAVARKQLLDLAKEIQLSQLLEAPIVLEPFIETFLAVESCFIHSVVEREPGIYFASHQAPLARTYDPVQELRRLCGSLEASAASRGLPGVAEALHTYGAQLETLRAYLPEQVFPLSAVESQQQEVEEETEQALEQVCEEAREIEEEQQISNAPQVAAYLPRMSNYGKRVAAQALIPPIDADIYVTDAFLPLNRSDPVHKRSAFDAYMSRIGSLLVGYDERRIMTSIVIGDLLDEVDPTNSIMCYLDSPDSASHGRISFFRYDIRLNQETTLPTAESHSIQADPRFIRKMAQIKFMDGRYDHYSPEELAALKAWIGEHDPREMKKQFNKILRYRSATERDRFMHSQLWNLFQRMMESSSAGKY